MSDSTILCPECTLSGGAHKKSCSRAPRLTNERLAEAFLKEHPGWQRLEKCCVMDFARWLDQRPADEPKCPCGTAYLRVEGGYVPVCACAAKNSSVVEPSGGEFVPDIGWNRLTPAEREALWYKYMSSAPSAAEEIAPAPSNEGAVSATVGAGPSVKSNAEWQLGPNTTHAHCHCIINGTFVDSSKCPVHGLSQRTNKE